MIIKQLDCLEFQWDEGNKHKNWYKHGISHQVCEQVFFNQPLLVADDVKHSTLEQRYYALGETDDGRRVFVCFTIRGKYIRVISARDMTRKELRIYEKACKKTYSHF